MKKGSKSNGGWTVNMQKNRYPSIYNRTGIVVNGFYHGECMDKKVEVSNDTKIRQEIIAEIEKRCENGELLDEVANEISERPEIQEQFSYYLKNGIKTPLSTFFKNWYLGKKKNENRYKKLNGIEIGD